MSITRSVAFLASLITAAGAGEVARAQSTAAATGAAVAQYVAMGSSFAAGPGIGTTVPDSPPRCARSVQNYAHVLASKRHLSLVDVSCSGATTNDVLRSGQFQLPPQLDAITPQTQLVTVTIGGNDVFYMANLIALSCDQRSSHVQSARGGCTVLPDAMVEQRFSALPDSLRQIVSGARSRSPNVRVVFVNYFTVLPDEGTCTRVHLSAAETEHMRGIAARLADITQKVAKEMGAGLFDLATLSHGHDACSSDPWLLGARRESGASIPPFHPTPQAMRAVGEALAAYPGLLH